MRSVVSTAAVAVQRSKGVAETTLRSLLLATRTSSSSDLIVSRFYSSTTTKEEEEEEDNKIGYYTGKKRNPLTDTRLHQYDQRPPPNALCEKCSRRFCSCEENVKTKREPPEMPGPEDCCQSTPQCKFCVWTIYDEQLAEYETNKELYMDKLK